MTSGSNSCVLEFTYSNTKLFEQQSWETVLQTANLEWPVLAKGYCGPTVGPELSPVVQESADATAFEKVALSGMVFGPSF